MLIRMKFHTLQKKGKKFIWKTGVPNIQGKNIKKSPLFHMCYDTMSLENNSTFTKTFIMIQYIFIPKEDEPLN